MIWTVGIQTDIGKLKWTLLRNIWKRDQSRRSGKKEANIVIVMSKSKYDRARTASKSIDFKASLNKHAQLKFKTKGNSLFLKML